MENSNLDIYIAIVEDDLMSTKLVEAHLHRMGYTSTKSFRSYEDAYISFLTESPSIIVMDIHLAGGFTGIEGAKASSDLFDCDIIYISNITEEDVISEARKTHPLGFLKKPVSPRKLGSALSQSKFLA